MGFAGKQEAGILIKDTWKLTLLSSLDMEDGCLLMLFNARIWGLIFRAEVWWGETNRDKKLSVKFFGVSKTVMAWEHRASQNQYTYCGSYCCCSSACPKGSWTSNFAMLCWVLLSVTILLSIRFSIPDLLVMNVI